MIVHTKHHLESVFVALAGVLLLAALARATPRIDTVTGNGTPTIIGYPFGVELGPDGALYICEVGNHRIQRLDLQDGTLTTIAGTGTAGYSGDGGPAPKAELNEPYEIRFDEHGNTYFVEMQNHIVRRIEVQSGIISTIAGTGKLGFGGDGGPAKAAQLSAPHSIALGRHRQLFIADIGNHRIRRVDLDSGVIETVAGNGVKELPHNGQIAKGNALLGPRALFVTDRTMWIALREGHSVWTMNLDNGKLHHVAGTGKPGYEGDGGLALRATFNGPKGIAVGPHGDVYVVDTENQVIRLIDMKTKIVTTLAGSGPHRPGYGGDGGPAIKAMLDRPHGVCVDEKGTVYVGDTNTHRIRRVRQP